MDKQLDSKDKVIDYLQLKILAYQNKNWTIDYNGNGTILSTKEPSAPSYAKKIDLKPKRLDEKEDEV